MFEITPYARQSIIPSPVNIMMAEIAESFRPGIDINLGAGYVNERTIPKDLIVEALEAVNKKPEKYKLAFNYGGSKGTENLRTSIKNFYLSNHIGSLTESDFSELDIVIGTNGATSILESIAQIFKPGVVITSDPIYYIYGEYLQRMGFQLLTIPEDSHGLQIDLLEKEIEALGNEIERISFFYIVTVNNPSTIILSNTRRAEIVSLSKRLGRKINRDIPVFFDKAYEEIIHDPLVEKPVSGLKSNESGNVFEIGTLSKILAPALRIGYIIGKPGAFFSALIQRNNDVGFSASVIMQEIASYLLDRGIVTQLKKVNEEYSFKARKVDGEVKQCLTPYLESYSGGKAGFYFYLTFKEVLTCSNSDFFKYLSRQSGDLKLDGDPLNKNPKVIYLPGANCVNPLGLMAKAGQRQLRISYGYEELDQILKGIRLMSEACAYSLNKAINL